MFKKIKRYIQIAFYSLFYGMRSADKLLSTSNTDNEIDANGIGGIEQQQEQQSVYKDLLNGVVTEQVRQLRHEMYYAERKSREYQYGGGGTAKKTSMFDYQGKIDKSDGHHVKVVQENKQITSSMSDSGVEVYGNNVDVSNDITTLIRNKPRSEKEYRIKIDREGFIPKFKIENYVKKLVVKELEGKKVLIDLYISKYFDKFEKTSKLFHYEMEKIYQGLDIGSYKGGILDFKRLFFIAKDAYGVPDLTYLSYTNFKFDTILEFDGHYVLRFIAEEQGQEDLIQEFYHEATAEKCENHERRDGATINFCEVMAEQNQKYDVDSAEKLIDDMKGE